MESGVVILLIDPDAGIDAVRTHRRKPRLSIDRRPESSRTRAGFESHPSEVVFCLTVMSESRGRVRSKDPYGAHCPA